MPRVVTDGARGERLLPHGCCALRVVRLPHCDYLRVSSAGEPSALGFAAREKRWWRPGWWAQTIGVRTGQPPAFTADAEPAARHWPQAWGVRARPCRVDIACDVTGVMFKDEHRSMFTGRGATQAIFKGHELRTLYIGSRQSPVMLRIYLKSEHCNAADEAVWRANGWDARSPVWRIEYELKRRAVPRDLELPRDIQALWRDALARIRMCQVPPRTYSQQNKAPTHMWWLSLGTAQRATRRRSDLARPQGHTLAQLERMLDRVAVTAGVDILPKLIARLQRHVRVAKAGAHGEGQG